MKTWLWGLIENALLSSGNIGAKLSHAGSEGERVKNLLTGHNPLWSHKCPQEHPQHCRGGRVRTLHIYVAVKGAFIKTLYKFMNVKVETFTLEKDLSFI